MKRHGQMAAAPGGRRGKGLKAWTLQMRRFCRRSGRRQDRSGQRTPTSRQGKLERKRVAAGVGRKDHIRRGAERNLNYRLDFGARGLDFGAPGLPRANALSAPGELRRCGWRCLLRRRTSLRVKNRTDAARWGKYSAELSWSSTVDRRAGEMRAKRQRNRERGKREWAAKYRVHRTPVRCPSTCRDFFRFRCRVNLSCGRKLG
jgi:hypothetical protein